MILHVKIDGEGFPVLVREDRSGLMPVPEGMVAMSVSEYELYAANHKRPPNLAPFKIAAKRDINAFRDQMEAAVFPYLGTHFDANSRSILRILAVVSAAQSAIESATDFSITWTDAHNQQVLLSASDIIGMPVAMVDYANALHVSALEAKGLIDEAASEAEIANIVSDYRESFEA